MQQLPKATLRIRIRCAISGHVLKRYGTADDWFYGCERCGQTLSK